MSGTIGLPIEIVLDEMTVFDMQNRVVSQIKAVYDITSEQIIEKVHALHPDGNVTCTEFRTRSNLKKLAKIVNPKKLKSKGKIKADVPGKDLGPWDTVVYQDPEDPDRYFIQAGDFLYGSGRCINKEGAGLIIFVICITIVSLAAIGSATYTAKEGIDVDLKIEYTEDGFGVSLKMRQPDIAGPSPIGG